MSGRLFGVGLGPGDPELLTVKATRVLAGAGVVAYFAKAGRTGYARGIAGRWLKAGCTEIPLYYPVTTEVHFEHADYASQLSAFYGHAAERLALHLDAGRDVALICEGDPFFYGSFMHLYARLTPRFACEVVPGVTGMSGCWTAAAAPMTWGDDTLTVLPGTLPPATLRARLTGADAVVVMKIGQNLAKVRAALADAGLLARALYVERGTMAAEVVRPLADKSDDDAPYFSIILVPGQGRRP